MHKVLLVEDNDMNREMLSRRLLRKGFDVVMAVDGLQGLAMATSQRPDIILMDMSLPGIDGWEATRRIKADAATHDVPVIALTAHAMSDDRAKALAAGCDEFDTKPVDLPRLLAKMEALLNATPRASSGSANPVATAPSLAPDTADITLPAVAASLVGFKAELEHFCMQVGVPAAVQQDLQVVLDEICANVFRHAYPPQQPGPLRMRLRRREQALEITLSDHGRPFDPLARPAPDLSQAWDDRPIGGLGIHLIQSMTDQQRYRHSPDDGNELCLVKYLS